MRNDVSAGTRALMDAGRPLELLQNILTHYVELPCFLLEAGQWRTWHTLVNLRPKRTPLDYEDPWQWEGRIRYNERTLEQVSRGRRTLCPPQHGLYGLFVPVLKSGRCLGVLQCGPFLRAVPSEASLQRQWKALSGGIPRDLDPEFLEYAQAVVDTPVLDGPLVNGLRELLELFGAHLTGSLDGAAVAKRMAELQVKVFARRLWHRRWVEWQVIHRRFFRFNGDPKILMAWEREELGLTRFPSTVMAAKREGTGREWGDALAALAFQREARRVAQGLDEAMAYPLSNYGALLLSSPSPGLSAADAQAEILRQAGQFRDRLAQRLGCRVWVGVGRDCPAGFDLQDSYHEAVTALHVAVAQDRPVASHGELRAQGEGPTGLRHRVAALVREVGDAGGRRSARVRDTFVEAVVLGTRGRPEAARGAFLEVFHRLLEVLEARGTLAGADLAAFEAQLVSQMESALNLNEMLGRFEGGFQALVALLDRVAEGEKNLRLERARQALRATPERAWTLPEIARQFGFSTTTFSRDFSRFVGVPFSVFLLTQRLDKAKRLLREGNLPVGRVGEACGFHSPNYFLQIFKKKVGSSPGQFRSLPSKRT